MSGRRPTVFHHANSLKILRRQVSCPAYNRVSPCLSQIVLTRRNCRRSHGGVARNADCSCSCRMSNHPNVTAMKTRRSNARCALMGKQWRSSSGRQSCTRPSRRPLDHSLSVRSAKWKCVCLALSQNTTRATCSPSNATGAARSKYGAFWRGS